MTGVAAALTATTSALAIAHPAPTNGWTFAAVAAALWLAWLTDRTEAHRG